MENVNDPSIAPSSWRPKLERFESRSAYHLANRHIIVTAAQQFPQLRNRGRTGHGQQRDADHQRPQGELKLAAFAFRRLGLGRLGFHRRIIANREPSEQAIIGRLAIAARRDPPGHARSVDSCGSISGSGWKVRWSLLRRGEPQYGPIG